MARINLCVVADLLDDGVGPIVVQAQFGAERAVRADQTPHGRAVAVAQAVHVGGGHAHFLGQKSDVDAPRHEIHPCVVAMAHQGTQGLFGKGGVQNDMGGGIGQQRAAAHQGGFVRGIRVALPACVRRQGVVIGLKGHVLVGDAAEGHGVHQVQFGGGAGRDAHAAAVQIGQRHYAVRRAYHDAA